MNNAILCVSEMSLIHSSICNVENKLVDACNSLLSHFRYAAAFFISLKCYGLNVF